MYVYIYIHIYIHIHVYIYIYIYIYIHCSAMQHVAAHCNTPQHTSYLLLSCSRVLGPPVCDMTHLWVWIDSSSCNLLQSVAVYCSLLQSVAVCCSVWAQLLLSCIQVRSAWNMWRNELVLFRRLIRFVTHWVRASVNWLFLDGSLSWSAWYVWRNELVLFTRLMEFVTHWVRDSLNWIGHMT